MRKISVCFLGLLLTVNVLGQSNNLKEAKAVSLNLGGLLSSDKKLDAATAKTVMGVEFGVEYKNNKGIAFGVVYSSFNYTGSFDLTLGKYFRTTKRVQPFVIAIGGIGTRPKNKLDSSIVFSSGSNGEKQDYALIGHYGISAGTAIYLTNNVALVPFIKVDRLVNYYNEKYWLPKFGLAIKFSYNL